MNSDVVETQQIREDGDNTYKTLSKKSGSNMHADNKSDLNVKHQHCFLFPEAHQHVVTYVCYINEWLLPARRPPACTTSNREHRHAFSYRLKLISKKWQQSGPKSF